MKNVICALLVLGTGACKSQNGTANALKPEEFEKGISAGNIQVLDVRTAEEFKGGHIKNALQADWTNQTQFLDRIRYVDKEKDVYVYCLVGGRSAAAAGWMRSNGFKKVIELKGGFIAWKQAGKPVEGSLVEAQLTPEQYLASIPTDKTALVDFGATWCPPCVKMQPVVEELVKKNDPAFQFISIDAGVHTNLMKALNVEPIPTFIIYKNGKESWRKSGIVSKEELLAQLR